jgi:xanthine dehydrogenase YagR molybdenum-binding subunit
MEHGMSITTTSPDLSAPARTNVVGKSFARTEADQKVSGALRYTAEIPAPGLCYGVLVTSPIARGRIMGVDTRSSEAVPGVLKVFTHETMPWLPSHPEQPDWDIMYGSNYVPMEGPEIVYAGQPIGYVVAETLEAAQYAAEIVRYTFETETPVVHLDRAEPGAPYPDKTQPGHAAGLPYHEPDEIWLGYVAGTLASHSIRGKGRAALAQAEVRLDGSWKLSYNHHNPMELVALTAVWETPDRLLVYETSQTPNNFRNAYAKLLGLPRENVRVVSSYVGGGFGCKGPIWPHSWLTVLAAREVGRPVRLVLSRQQMYTSVGHREEQRLDVSLGTDRDGRLVAMDVTKTSPTPEFEDWAEPAWYPFTYMYACPNLQTRLRLVRANIQSPTFMRAPGEAPGVMVQECAINELAAQLGVDPIELRLRNHADVYPIDGSPWSSKLLKECYARGAERVEWHKRNPEPRSVRDGRMLLGMGMASVSHTVYRKRAAARVTIAADGSAHAAASASDIGTGTATFMRQITAEELGLPFGKVTALIGDTGLPEAPMQAGASLAASLGSATLDAARRLRSRLVHMAVSDRESPLHGLPADQVIADCGCLVSVPGTAREPIHDILRRAGFTELSAEGHFDPGGVELGHPGNLGGHETCEDAGSWRHTGNTRLVRTGDPKRDAREGRRGMHSWGSVFATVAVDPDFGLIRVRRLTGVYACGRILNPKLAESQLIGGITWGMSQALFEATHMDRRYGRFMNSNYAEYLMPVNADVPTIEVEFLEDPDPYINPAGVKGVGEIGIVGVAAAIVDAVWNATGKRLRELPITAEAVL